MSTHDDSSNEPNALAHAEGNPLHRPYEPLANESHWYAQWMEQGCFEASEEVDDHRATYAIAIPPPNVTGSLHMGHACRVAFEDVLVRFHRMLGRNTLWIPGVDHAGIATQVVVERKLKAQGTTRQDVGREAFLEKVWEWKAQSGGRILQQLRELGASCDWSRERFTMDDDYSTAVKEAFVRLYEEGLIYRGTRLVNWDITTQTVLSDLEVENEEGVEGELFEFAYPVEGSDAEVVVATTRPETMFGDTGIAVHPDDPRYTHLHGGFVVHPFVNRRIPIVCDAELVDPEFGTGVVKVTPAHDFNDFATGKRHGLEEINVLNPDGTLNEQGGDLQGMDRFKARDAVKEALEAKGLARGTRKHTLTLPRSQRSGTVVEPMISTQWFVAMDALAKPAVDAVREGEVKIVPEDWTKTYYHWMENIQDWCISRQLWWGHPIPAWHCKGCDHVTVSRTTPTACGGCGGAEITPDPDVLDTWFSSSLWPFATLGWPEKTQALKRFYPTQDLETGYDILFFWVARMMVMGIHFMGEPPFKRVLLSGMVTDERGQKMSKVKGNVIDPLDVIKGASLDELLAKAEKAGAKKGGIQYLKKTYPDGFATYGADALRMTLLSYSPRTRRIALSIKRVEGYRNFANKLWNSARFVLDQVGDAKLDACNPPQPTLGVNQWLLSTLDDAVEKATRAIEEYRVDDAVLTLYHFVWDQFCDWGIEFSKAVFTGDDETQKTETRLVLLHTLDSIVRALHPMMPFITEAIWQRIPRAGSNARQTIMVAPYPTSNGSSNTQQSWREEVPLMQNVIRAVRTTRAEHDIPRRTTIDVFVATKDATQARALAEGTPWIRTLCNAHVHMDSTPEGYTASNTVQGIQVDIPLTGIVDLSVERQRLEKQNVKIDKDIALLTKKLANPNFVDRAPPEVVTADRARLMELEQTKQANLLAMGRLG